MCYDEYKYILDSCCISNRQFNPFFNFIIIFDKINTIIIHSSFLLSNLNKKPSLEITCIKTVVKWSVCQLCGKYKDRC